MQCRVFLSQWCRVVEGVGAEQQFAGYGMEVLYFTHICLRFRGFECCF